MLNKFGNINAGLEHLHRTGGFAYSFDTGELNPQVGFSLAISKEYEKIITNAIRYKRSAIEEEIKKYAREHIELLAQPNRFLGAWTDKGNLYIDISEVVATMEEAVRLCKERQQLAYWDNSAGRAVFIENIVSDGNQYAEVDKEAEIKIGDTAFSGDLGFYKVTEDDVEHANENHWKVIDKG